MFLITQTAQRVNIQMDDVNTSEYDMSFSTFGRINYELWNCNLSQKEGDALKWLNSCRVLYKEVFPFLTEKEAATHKNLLCQAEKSANEFISFQANYKQAQGRIAYKPPRLVFDVLQAWECELRKKLDKIGLLMRKSDSAYGAMI